MIHIAQRALAALALVMLLGACTSVRESHVGQTFGLVPPAYGPMFDEEFPVPSIKPGMVRPRYFRTQVPNPTDEEPGTIVVDPDAKYLYLVEEGGVARRYGIGVGREGFDWSGKARIGRKAKWPKWTPPAEMIEREPRLEEFREGMDPGLMNPLGARALYLYEGGEDTLYRIHGTNEPQTIGSAVSSGCIRMLNHDVADLYERVDPGARVVVL